jgi:CheY-like chemotaxis protein
VSQPTVFIVEDDVDTREMIGRFLELEGFAVETAANGRQALDRLDAGARACVILLDLMMPVMDGWAFRAAQRELTGGAADVPVIVLSAAREATFRTGELGVAEALSKPFELTQIVEAVERWIGSGPSA